jgi:MoxR-like ATPase
MKSLPLRLHGDHHGRDDKPYRASPELLTAANTALLLETPLLLAGEPGCGKTDFAWYAARALAQALKQPDHAKKLPLECYIHSDTSATELLYQYDSLARFADSQQRQTAPVTAPIDFRDPRDPRNYIALEPLGQALLSRERCVLLIDEIDKAPRDLSNDLLRELDQGRFAIREIPKQLTDHFPDPNDDQVALVRDMYRPVDKNNKPLVEKPLVIVTSNAERQLPDAFLRRCVYFYIHFPRHDELVRILQDRIDTTILGSGWGLDGTAQQAFLDHSVTVVESLRQPAVKLVKRPGTAETIGWVRTLAQLYERSAAEKLAAAAQSLKNQKGVAWNKLPGLHCLVKLKEDLDALEKASAKTA